MIIIIDFLNRAMSYMFPIGESLFTFFAPLTQAYHYMMKLTKCNF